MKNLPSNLRIKFEPKRIRPSKAPGPNLSNKPVIARVASAAIPPQNLAYRWLYEKPVDYFAVPTVTPPKY